MQLIEVGTIKAQYWGFKMNTQHLVTSKTIEIIRQKSRKLKKEKNIIHTQALDEIAQQYHFNHWHHVRESYKVLKPTEQSVKSGLMIAMNAKDADSFYDEKERFIQDDNAFFFCEKDIYHQYIEAIDEDGLKFIDKYSEEELRQDFKDEYIMNYGFFRYTASSLPKTINDILKLIKECSFWQPEYIWFNEIFYNKTAYLEQLPDVENPFSDFDFDHVNIVNHKEDITEYLLKIVDGASLVLKKYNTDSTPELLVPRQDLFSSIRLKPSPFRRTDLSQMIYSINGLSLWQSYSL
ncbi:MAG: hypothetical protein GQ532_08015 [Methylomarinum sp.]|nr:hypothetical protein [Methylomarinum sp.]